MKKVLSISDICLSQNCVEEFMYILEQDLENKYDEFKSSYVKELEVLSLKLDRLINYMNDNDVEEEDKKIIDVEEDDDKLCLFVKD